MKKWCEEIGLGLEVFERVWTGLVAASCGAVRHVVLAILGVARLGLSHLADDDGLKWKV